MAVRSRTLGTLTTLTPNVATVLFESPADRTAIVRHWSVVNRSNVARTVVVSVRRAGTTVNIWRQAGVPHNGQAVDTRANLVIDPGDALLVFVSAETGASNDVHCYAAGSLLDGPPA